MLGGYSLARYKFKGKQTVILFFLVTQMIPGILVIIPLYIIFSKMGLINTHIGLFIFYVTANLPFCVITMRSFFERIPVTLEEAARVDGCTKMQSLFKIVFPIMFPGIVSVFAVSYTHLFDGKHGVDSVFQPGGEEGIYQSVTVYADDADMMRV